VEGGFFGVEPAEPADVLAQDDARLAAPGIGAELEQRQELAPAPRVQPAHVVRELPHDRVALHCRPAPYGLPLLFPLSKLGNKKGGKARWEGVSAEERSALARKAARARWGLARKKR